MGLDQDEIYARQPAGISHIPQNSGNCLLTVCSRCLEKEDRKTTDDSVFSILSGKFGIQLGNWDFSCALSRNRTPWGKPRLSEAWITMLILEHAH